MYNKKNEKGEYTKPVVRRSFFGAKYLYLDGDTRVRYGFSLTHVGTTYTLQRKKGIFWKEVAWTYPVTFIGKEIDRVIEHLKWQEENKKRLKTKCLF